MCVHAVGIPDSTAYVVCYTTQHAWYGKMDAVDSPGMCTLHIALLCIITGEYGSNFEGKVLHVCNKGWLKTKQYPLPIPYSHECT